MQALASSSANCPMARVDPDVVLAWWRLRRCHRIGRRVAIMGAMGKGGKREGGGETKAWPRSQHADADFKLAFPRKEKLLIKELRNQRPTCHGNQERRLTGALTTDDSAIDFVSQWMSLATPSYNRV